ncbi:hypothetical protein DBR32_03540 [Taibaiella sp. KBW10]|uniref:type IX secretion system protein PorG n=1 Tax=Taibaiella sp. KBW10 TaxID=2153357 RepID=UPI000F5B338A|nr:DUF6089 family protein [Taibaiella sp. KBW10]RQO31890.1 hypothetical protein DBR32_03540 [Taibaiella sp. KBW10]
MRLKKFMVLAVCIGSSIVSNAQKFFERQEYGIMAGAAQYFGDLNPEYGFKNIRPAGGIFYRYYFNPYISLRVGLSYVQLGYKDSYSSNAYQQTRNLSFQNNLLEATVIGEFNFFRFQTGNIDRRYTPYMVLGVGALYSNPFVMHNGKKTYLQPLGTEGQNLTDYRNRRYNKINAVVPFGAGIKCWLAPGVNLGVEVVHRFAFTDYLDDVSQSYVGVNSFTPSGNANTASLLQDPSKIVNGQKLGRIGKQRGDNATIDQYLVGQITLSFQLKTYKCPSNSPLWDNY